MDFRELLKVRRSIREFEVKDVSLPLIQEIIADGCEAPNGGNRQPWAFIIITNKDMMKRLSDESKKNILQEIDRSPASTLDGYKAILQAPGFNVFYNAPCLIYIAGSRNVHSATVDCTLAASYLMFSAADRGLGTCWINLGSVIKDQALLKEIGLPDDYAIVATIILGYPVKMPEKTPRDKPKILKIMQ
ncbi:MAG: nitroreductase family protein [Desulfomonilia bacterium]|jgi:nitroreductase